MDDIDNYRINLLAKAIKEIDDKTNVLSEETREALDLYFQWVDDNTFTT